MCKERPGGRELGRIGREVSMIYVRIVSSFDAFLMWVSECSYNCMST